MLGGVTQFKPPGQPPGFSRLEGFIERGDSMGVEVVAYNNHDFRACLRACHCTGSMSNGIFTVQDKL